MARLREVEVSSLSWVIIAAPRNDFDTLLKRPKANGCGIYFLYSNEPNPVAYIGAADCLNERLPDHFKRTYWQNVIIFTTKDDSLTKAHAWFLEGKLISEALHNKNYILQNEKSSGAKLPESDLAEMESYLYWLRDLLPALGCDLLSNKSKDQEVQMVEPLINDSEDFWPHVASVLPKTDARLSKNGEVLKVFFNLKKLLAALQEATPARYSKLTVRELRQRMRKCKERIDGQHVQRFSGKLAKSFCFGVHEGHPLYDAATRLPQEAWLR